MTRTYVTTSTAGRFRALRRTGDLAWRILIIAVGYMVASLIAGSFLGREFEFGAPGISLLSGILIGATLSPIAAQERASRSSHGVAWGSALFLNAPSVAIERGFFAPTMSPMVSMPVAWTTFLLFQSLVTASLVAWLCGQSADARASTPLRNRAWYSWAWRFVVSSFSYLLFYFIFGVINYALVTKPYYTAHVSGLTVPAAQTVLMAELVRAPMIAPSIVPFILLWKGRRRVLAVLCGTILFVIGGVLPLLLNTALPDLLRIASGVEIFFQNFLTGVIAAALLGFRAVQKHELNEGETR